MSNDEKGQDDGLVNGSLNPDQAKAFFAEKEAGLGPGDHLDPAERELLQLSKNKNLPKSNVPREDIGIKIPEGAAGVDVFSGNAIVEAKPQESSGFIRSLPSTDKPVETPQDSSFNGILQIVRKTGVYTPFVLPSNGLLYGDGNSGGEIHVRPMKAGEEEILATPHMFASGKAIDAIFARCIDFKNFPVKDPADLLSLDRTALLILIRTLSYGPDYHFHLNCYNCGKSFEGFVNTSENLEVYHLQKEAGLQEPIRSVFPVCELEFTYRLSRGKDELELMRLRNERASKSDGKATNNVLHEKAKLVVESIAGITDKSQIEIILSELVAGDLHHLRDCVESPPFGVDDIVRVDCVNCRTENRVRLPMGPEFFMPPVRTTKDSTN